MDSPPPSNVNDIIIRQPDKKWSRGDQYSYDGNPQDREGDSSDEEDGVEVSKITDHAKTEAVIKGLKLHENPLLCKHPDVQRRAISLVSEYTDVFSDDGEKIGLTDLVEFKISVKPGVRPIKQKTRPLNPTQLASLR